MPHYPVVLTPDENGTVIAEVPDIDLDGMNWVNDNFGHPVGDAFLRDAGIFCSDIAKQHCVDAYRTDGDEITFAGDDAVRTSQTLDADRALAQDQHINQQTEQGVFPVQLAFSGGGGTTGAKLMSDSTKTKGSAVPLNSPPSEATSPDEAVDWIRRTGAKITGPAKVVPKKSAATETSPHPLPNLDLSTLENLDWNAPGTGFEVLKAIAALQEPQEASDVPSVPQ